MDDEKPKFVARKAVPSRPQRIVEEGRSYQFRSNPHPTTTLVGVLMWLLIAVAGVQFFLNLTQISELRNPPPQKADFDSIQAQRNYIEETEKTERIQALMAQVALVINIVSLVVFLIWVFLANSNSWGFVGSGLKASPGWAVICFLVPVVNLFRPFHAMQEIWKVSVEPRSWQAQEESKLVTRWWAVAILGIVLFAVQFWLLADDRHPPETVVLLPFAILIFAQAGLFAWMTIKVTRAIVKNQDALVGVTERMRKSKPAPISPLPPNTY